MEFRVHAIRSMPWPRARHKSSKRGEGRYAILISMILYECRGFLEVGYVEDKDYLVFAWRDFAISLKEIMKAHRAALDFAVSRGCMRYIADCSQAKDALLPEVIVWWRNDWVPVLAEAGLRRIVTIIPSSGLATLSNRDWQRDPKKRIEILNVESLASAVALLP
jgi:hypothetical protein